MITRAVIYERGKPQLSDCSIIPEWICCAMQRIRNTPCDISLYPSRFDWLIADTRCKNARSMKCARGYSAGTGERERVVLIHGRNSRRIACKTAYRADTKDTLNIAVLKRHGDNKDIRGNKTRRKFKNVRKRKKVQVRKTHNRFPVLSVLFRFAQPHFLYLTVSSYLSKRYQVSFRAWKEQRRMRLNGKYSLLPLFLDPSISHSMFEHATETRLRNGGRHVIKWRRVCNFAIPVHLLPRRCPRATWTRRFPSSRFPREFSTRKPPMPSNSIGRMSLGESVAFALSRCSMRIRSLAWARTQRSWRSTKRKTRDEDGAQDGKKKTEDKDMTARPRRSLPDRSALNLVVGARRSTRHDRQSCVERATWRVGREHSVRGTACLAVVAAAVSNDSWHCRPFARRTFHVLRAAPRGKHDQSPPWPAWGKHR